MTITSSSQQSFGAKGEIDDLLSELAQLWPNGVPQPASQDDLSTRQNPVLPATAATDCESTRSSAHNEACGHAPQATPELMVHVTTATHNSDANSFLTQETLGRASAPTSEPKGNEQAAVDEAPNSEPGTVPARPDGLRQNPWGPEPGNQAYGNVACGVPQNNLSGRTADNALFDTPESSTRAQKSIPHNPWAPYPDEDDSKAPYAPAVKQSTRSKRNRMRYNPWDLSLYESDDENVSEVADPQAPERHNPWGSDSEPVDSRGSQNGALRNLKLPVVNGSPLRNPPPLPSIQNNVAPDMMPSALPKEQDFATSDLIAQVAAVPNVHDSELVQPISPYVQSGLVVASLSICPQTQNEVASDLSGSFENQHELVQNLMPPALPPASDENQIESCLGPDYIAPQVQFVQSILMVPDGLDQSECLTDPGISESDEKNWRLSQGQPVQWSIDEGQLEDWPVRPDPDGRHDRKSPVEQTQQLRQQQMPARMLQSTRGEETAVCREQVAGRGSMVSAYTSSAESEANQEAVMELLRGLPDSVHLTEPMSESLESMLQTERLSPASPLANAQGMEQSLEEKLIAELTEPAQVEKNGALAPVVEPLKESKFEAENVETVRGSVSQEFTLSEMPGDVGKWLAELAEEIPVQDYPLLSFLPDPVQQESFQTAASQTPTITPVVEASVPVDRLASASDLSAAVLSMPATAVTEVFQVEGCQLELGPVDSPQVVLGLEAEYLPALSQRDFSPGEGVKLSHYDGFADADHAESNYGASDNRLGQLMVEMGLISTEQLDNCVRIATELSLPLGRVLIMSGWINGRQLEWSIQLQAFLKDGLINLDTCRAVADLMTCSGMTLKRALNCAGYSDAYGSTERRATRLGDFLIESAIVKAERYYEVLNRSQSLGIPVGRLLVISGLISTQLLECAINVQRFVREGRVSRQDAIALLQSAAKRHADQTGRSFQPEGAQPVPLKTMRLGELLSLSGIASEAQIEHALEIGLKSNLPVGRVLVDLQVLSGYTLEMALALQSLVSRDAIEPLDAAYALIDIHHHNLTLTQALEKNRSLSERRTLSFEQFIASLELISKDQIKDAVEIACRSPLFVSKALVFSGALAESTMQIALLCHFYLREGMLSAEEAMLLFNHCHKSGLSIDEGVAELSLQLRTAV